MLIHQSDMLTDYKYIGSWLTALEQHDISPKDPSGFCTAFTIRKKTVSYRDPVDPCCSCSLISLSDPEQNQVCLYFFVYLLLLTFKLEQIYSWQYLYLEWSRRENHLIFLNLSSCSARNMHSSAYGQY